MTDFNVTKRSGQKEVFSLDKIHRVLTWAAENLDGVSVSEVALHAKIQLVEGIKTSDIHRILTKTAADKITDNNPDYQYMAARLEMFDLRKKAYGQFKPPRLYDHVKKLVEAGKYDDDLLNYSEGYFDEVEKHIDHWNDMNLTYGAIKQLSGKYLVQNRVTEEIYETPQFAFILIPMTLFANYPEPQRKQLIVETYKAVTEKKISFPTPIMGGVRTPTRQFSSCVLIESDDSLDSINATAGAIVKYVSQRAGIGVNAGRIRALGSTIRNGEAFHTGCIPFYKHFQTAVKSCSQGGIRGGAATVFYPLWHLEVESLLVLKNNRGVDENRVRHMDYGVQFNGLLYKRLLAGKDITLFSPSDVPGLYDAFFEDQDEFERLYLKYEADESIRKKSVPAVELFSTFLQERASTGRIYVQNVDHSNTHSPFDSAVAPVRQSNLCVVGETLILTSEGYKPIGELVGQAVNVWNGHEFSEVTIEKTGENQKIVKVMTDSGQDIECTEYHKFYVKNDYYKEAVEVRAHELKPGDRLIKVTTPLLFGGKRVLDKAYVNGFYSGDGCLTRQGQRIYLYGDKRNLADQFDHEDASKWTIQEECNRQYRHYKDLEDKFFVPDAEYSADSRLAWLAGWLDADGSVYRNGDNEQLVGSSTNLAFLKQVQLMLQTLGAQSKIRLCQEEGSRLMPTNDGTGDKKEYHCKTLYRLIITSGSVQALRGAGLRNFLKRLKIHTHEPNREAIQHVKIVEVKDEGRIADTYCFNEPLRHMGVFNGLLTGQCLEISLPTKPLNNVNDPDGEVALCTLAAFNLGEIEYEEIPQLADLLVRLLDALLDYQNYPLPAAERSTMYRRTLGVGVINYAYFLAKNGVRYSDGSANNLTHKWFEKIQHSLMSSSVQLAKEFGPCPGFKETRMAKGILPIDTHKEEVDKHHSEPYHCDWEALREDMMTYGIRNSTLSALMPSETSSQVSSATNGIEPPRGLVSVKTSKDGVLNQVVPEVEKYRDQYELLWDIPNNTGYLQLCGIMQKFVCQAISANTNYDPEKFPSGKVPMKQLMGDLLLTYKLGLKTLYYHNTRDGQKDEGHDGGCDGGACKI